MKRSVNFAHIGPKRKHLKGIKGFVGLAKFVGMNDDEVMESVKNIANKPEHMTDEDWQAEQELAEELANS